MEQIDELSGDIEKIKQIIEEIRKDFPETPSDLVLSTTSNLTAKSRYRKIRDSLPKIPQDIQESAHTRHDLDYILRQLSESSRPDEFKKTAVILEDIYYGIFAKSGIYAEKLDHKGPDRGKNNSMSYYNPQGDWRVDVYNSNGEFSFTYLGYFEQHFEGGKSHYDHDDHFDEERFEGEESGDDHFHEQRSEGGESDNDHYDHFNEERSERGYSHSNHDVPFDEEHSEGGDSDNSPPNFRCAVMSAPGLPKKHKEFDNFHDLIFFLIDIVLSGGEWR